MKNFYTYFYVICLCVILSSCSSDSNSDAVDDLPVIDKTLNQRGLGESAHDLLSDDKYTSMNIEVLYVNGFQPTTAAMENFKSFLEERTFKPDGITISYQEVESSGLSPFEIEEVYDIEKEKRSFYSVGDEISVYIYFADGSNEGDTDKRFILGSAYRNTSMVIYGETIDKFAARVNAPSKSVIETAVLNHEFGHLFGLVNVGTELQSDHEDEENNGHCTEENCLMRASLEFGSGIIDQVRGTPPEMGPKCIADLRANGGK
ncbi:hypothetical protein [Zunongwangia sp. HGR-M22]|uniref:hypothetical protein n=1 Tax=Zunongwangia sp. HGR-M22 TaxID=3015168 RepID=UPI0022DE0892|nr:hypothetical protein [Zunongwangia sp. HGR-M22]WBL24838.1 hypothetical protein PBT91_13115 [Zunongwangia sp. HGR-M22]